MKKNILLLFCWWTISMTKNEETWALDIANWADQLFKLEPRIVELANIDVMYVANLDSSNATPRIWETIWDTIYEKYNEYDGFLITTWTNTMAFMASALTFSLSNLWKPVVLTWAQIPAESILTDWRNNLVNALRVTTMDLWWVFLVFWSKLLLWCRSKKVSESDLDAFASFNQKEFWEIWIWIKLNFDTHKSHHNQLILKNGFEENVMSITLFPWINNDYLLKMIDLWIKWFVLRWFWTWDVPDYIFPFLEKAREKEIPIVVTTQCRWSTMMWIDSVWFDALKLWVIEAYDMSMETMMWKLMWLLKQWYKYDKIKDMMQRNFYSEVNTTKARVFRNQELQRQIDSL